MISTEIPTTPKCTRRDSTFNLKQRKILSPSMNHNGDLGPAPPVNRRLQLLSSPRTPSKTISTRQNGHSQSTPNANVTKNGSSKKVQQFDPDLMLKPPTDNIDFETQRRDFFMTVHRNDLIRASELLKQNPVLLNSLDPLGWTGLLFMILC